MGNITEMRAGGGYRVLKVLMALILVVSLTPLPKQAYAAPVTAANVNVQEAIDTFSIDYATKDNADADHNGSSANKAFRISTAKDLADFGEKVNNGETFSYTTETERVPLYVQVTNDIDLSSVPNWTPIGGGSYEYTYTSDNDNRECTDTDTRFFMGDFNGGNHTISGLTISTDNGSGNYGLFGAVAKTASLHDFVVEGQVTVTAVGASNISGVVGVVGDPSSAANVSIFNVGNRVALQTTISDATPNEVHVGGIVAESTNGWNESDLPALNINRCFNTGSIQATGGGDVGGIMGKPADKTSTVVSSCYNTGDLTMSIEGSVYCYYAGLVAANSYGTSVSIDKCYNTGKIPDTSGVNHVIGNYVDTSVGNYYLKDNEAGVDAVDSYSSGKDKQFACDSEAELIVAVTTLDDYEADSNATGNYLNDGLPVLAWQLKDANTGINTTELQKAISAAENAMVGVEIGTDEAEVDQGVKFAPQTSHDELTQAIQAAKDLLKKDDAKQSEIDTASANLSEKTTSFTTALKTGKKVTYALSFSMTSTGVSSDVTVNPSAALTAEVASSPFTYTINGETPTDQTKAGSMVAHVYGKLGTGNEVSLSDNVPVEWNTQFNKFFAPKISYKAPNTDGEWSAFVRITWTIDNEVVKTAECSPWTIKVGDPSNPKYTVSTQVVKNTSDDNVEPGTLAVSPTEASSGATITVTPEAAVGFTFDKVEWKVESATDWTPLTSTGGAYTFTMPAENVTVRASFTDGRIDITGADLKFFDDSYPYTGSKITVEPTGIRGGAKFSDGDYEVFYKRSEDATEEVEFKDAGTYWVTVTGKNHFKGSVSKTVEIVKGFDVYYKNPGDKKETKAKHFSEEEFAKLAVTDKDPVSANYNGNMVASTQNYVELGTLLEAAGIADKWTSGATVSYNGGECVYGHDELLDTKFFPKTTKADKSTEGAVSAPLVIALTQASSEIKEGKTAQDVETANVAAATGSSCPRVIVGLTEALYTGAETSLYKAAGRRLWNNTTSITVTTAADKAASTLSLTAKNPSVTYSDSAQTIKAADAFTVANAKRAVTYSLESTSAGIAINASTGDITLPAKLAAGSYTVKVKVADQGDDTTVAGTATADLKITVNAAKTGAKTDAKTETKTETKTDKTSTAKPTSIAKAKVTLKAASAAYTGKTQKGAVKSVKLGTKTLKQGTDYTVSAKSGKKVGTYTVTVTGKGNYTGTAKATFKIVKASQAIAAKNFTVTYKGKKLVKGKKLAKAQTIDVKAKAKASAKTAIKYAKANKVGGKSIAVNAKTGKITVKKGLKAGTYKVKVKLTAAKNSSYNAAKAKTITVTVKVAKK